MCNDDDDKTTFLIPHPVPDIQQQHYEYLLFVEVSPCFVLNLNLNAGPRGRSGGLGTGTVRIGSMAVRLWAIVVHQTAWLDWLDLSWLQSVRIPPLSDTFNFFSNGQLFRQKEAKLLLSLLP
jgi:hypothetical protein